MVFLIASLLVAVSYNDAGAVSAPLVSLDKKSYTIGDTVKISVKLEELKEGMPVILQVRSPSDIVSLDQFVPNSKSFTKGVPADGPKWSESGQYTVVVSYLGEKSEKVFQFTKQKEIQKPPAPKPQPMPPKHVPQEEEVEKPIPQQQVSKPRISIKDFPDPSLPPVHYYNRYNTEVAFKEWFDSVYVGYTPQEALGYPKTHVQGFPDPQRPPQYYIDRYNKEAAYREWFDSQFPGMAIQDIVMPERFRNIIPAWVKDTAKLWSSGDIDDSRFASAIQHLVDQEVIHSEIQSNTKAKPQIPPWVKNNAQWWSQGMITDNDFLFGIEELIRRGVITAR